MLTVALGACLLLPLAALTLSAEAPQLLPSASAATPAAAVATVPLLESGSARAGNGGAASPRLTHVGSPVSGAAAGWPAGRGRDAFLKDCTGCHAAEDVIGHEQDAKGWTNVLNEMTRFGASIPKVDFADVVDYLGTNFGVKSASTVTRESQPAAGDSGGSSQQQTAAAPAQTAASASVSGVVEDPSGAVIPGAVVEWTYESNLASGEVVAGQDGGFTFPALVPGSYQLTVDAMGFRKYSQKGIQLQAGEHLNLHEIDLQVGTITQEVTVTGSESAPTGGNEAEQAQQQPCAAPAVQAVPPLPPPPPGRIRIGGSVEQASIVCQSMPLYPAIARTAHVQGTVVLHAIIGKDGSVTSLEFVSGPSLLTNAAMQAVKQWRYKPLVLDGQPVEVDSEVYVVFTLNP